jgi:5-formyltetrahydrofolate cyclo-ligase
VDLSALAEFWIAKSKPLCLPRIDGSFLKVFQISAWSRDLLARNEIFGIWEPRADAVPVELSDIDCVCVPGLAFDAKGYRLGHGQGFYDRFLGQIPHTYKIGVCFKYHLREELPREDHDIKVDRVISLS